MLRAQLETPSAFAIAVCFLGALTACGGSGEPARPAVGQIQLGIRNASGELVVSSSSDFTYDEGGFLVAATSQDAQGNATDYTFSYEDGRLSAVDIVAPAANAGNLWTVVYDDAGRVARLDQGQDAIVTYVYDGEGRLSTQTTPGLLSPIVSTYDYDDAGRLSSVRTESEALNLSEIELSYDEDGRLSTILTAGPVGSNSTELMYADGRLSGLTESGNPVTLEYDDSGRISETILGAVTAVIEYEDFEVQGGAWFQPPQVGRAQPYLNLEGQSLSERVLLRAESLLNGR